MSVSFGPTGNGGGLTGLQLAVLAGLLGAGAILLGAVFLSRRSRRAPPAPFTISSPPSAASPPWGAVAVYPAGPVPPPPPPPNWAPDATSPASRR
jgi:hypothetical protein